MSLSFIRFNKEFVFHIRSYCLQGVLSYQILIVDLKLAYPSGLATAVLINGFHSRGDKMAKYIYTDPIQIFAP